MCIRDRQDTEDRTAEDVRGLGVSGRAHTGEPPAGPGAMGSAHGASGAGAAALARLRSVGTDPLSELAHIKERTGLMAMGYFDSYLPEELIMAPVSYTHLRAHETVLDLVCRL